MKAFYKVYNDGSHYLATRYLPPKAQKKARYRSSSKYDEYFDMLYLESLQAGLKGVKQRDYIFARLVERYPDYDGAGAYIERKIEVKQSNFYERKRRFKRKADLNNWNHFVTITYDNKKQTEESFRTRLKKCLANLHTRRGWRYMGVFERAPETGRLHFHALMYVPEGAMPGELKEIWDYSTKEKCMQMTVQNTFFLERFGRNDFEYLDQYALKSGESIEYILKYISKSDERILYSRAIPSFLVVALQDEDLAAELGEFVTKYVLFDDVITDEHTVNAVYDIEDMRTEEEYLS